MTSVKTSDQACAKYIIVDLMHVPGAAPKLFQFSEMGKHCSRFAAKKATVHVMVRPIMTQETMENVLVENILVMVNFHSVLLRKDGRTEVCYLR